MIIGLNGSGFISYHLNVYFKYKCTDIEVIQLQRNLSADLHNLKKCDVIIHMAEKNRGDENELYNNNIQSTTDLISALDSIQTQPLVIYTSSIHEDADNVYGKWRRNNKEQFAKWAKNNNFISIKLPNIYGPFCKPNYNSFIATLCDSLIQDKKINIIDNPISLLYVENLCKQIHEIILGHRFDVEFDVMSSIGIVTEMLTNFLSYIQTGKIPKFQSEFELNMFTTFRSYIMNPVFDVKHIEDNRGELKELVISKEQGQIFYSTTKPNVTRGNHFHTKRIERFCIVQGHAKIEMRKIGSNKIISYNIKDSDNKVIDMPPYYTHNLTNVGNDDLICVFWMNDILSEQAIDDTYFEVV